MKVLFEGVNPAGWVEREEPESGQVLCNWNQLPLIPSRPRCNAGHGSHLENTTVVESCEVFLSRCPDKPSGKVKLRLCTHGTQRLPARVLQEAGSGKGLGTQGTD